MTSSRRSPLLTAQSLAKASHCSSMQARRRPSFAPRTRQAVFVSPTASLPLSKDRGWIASPRLRFTTGHTLRIVPRYRHLGAIAVVSSRLAPELRHRITQARFAEHKLAANVLGQKQVAGRHSHQRGYRVQACLLYAAGTWDVMFDEATGPWQAAYISPLRRATVGHWTREDLGRPASVDQVMARAARPALPAAITAARLRFAALLLQGPMVVIALLQPRGVSAWSAHLCDDMRSMRNALQVQLAELPDPGFVVGPWCSIVREHRRPWKALVAQCQRFLVLLSTCVATDMGVCLFRSGPDMALEVQHHACLDCGKSCATVAALATYPWRAHGAISQVGQFVLDTIGPVSKRDFRTRQRVMAHMERGSLRCAMAWHTGALPPHPPSDVVAADVASRAFARTERAAGLNPLGGLPSRPAAAQPGTEPWKRWCQFLSPLRQRTGLSRPRNIRPMCVVCPCRAGCILLHADLPCSVAGCMKSHP